MFGKQVYFAAPRAEFRSQQSFGLVPDGGLMTVIASYRYAKQKRDIAFVHRHYKKLTRAMDWYEKKFGEHLISEWFLCEWADAVMKVGKTLYTNVLYYAALTHMASLAGLAKRPTDVKKYETRAKRVKALLHKEFWSGHYFADWIDWKKHDYLPTHANMLAIIFGLTSKKQSLQILRSAGKLWDKFTLTNTSRAYPFWRIPFQHHLIGLPDYHNGIRWLQPGITYAIALYQVGKRMKAKKIFSKIAKKIEQHGDVFEVYEVNGTPLRRWFYTSEHPFAWSAGVFLWAYKMIYR
jgi:glycogen debranching enzyme